MNIAIISTGVNPIVNHLSNHPNLALFVQAINFRKNSKIRFILKTLLFRLFATKKKTPLIVLEKHTFPSLRQKIQSLQIELIIIYSMPFLIPKEFMEIKNLTIINLHPSLLPSYRGPNPLEWAILNNESRTGFTLHYLEEGEDSGDIIFQSSFSIPRGLTKNEISNFETLLGIPLIDSLIHHLFNQKPIDAKPQMKGVLKRAKRLDIHSKYELIDWNQWPIERVWHCLRFMPEIIGQLDGIPKSRMFSFRVLDYFEIYPSHSSTESLPSCSFKTFFHAQLKTNSGIITLRRELKITTQLKRFWSHLIYFF